MRRSREKEENLNSVLAIAKFVILLIFAAIVLLSVFVYLNLPLPTKLLVVKSGSMEPAIRVGSLVLVAKQTENTFYSTGQVITFQKNKELVSHRVVYAVNQNGQRFYRTKGDANQTADSDLVPANKVVGSVNLIVPYLGRLTEFVKTPPGFIFLVVVPTLLIILSELLAIFKELHHKKPDTAVSFAKPLAMIVIANLFLGSSHAFFNSVATSTGNTFAAAGDFSKLRINEFVVNPGTVFTKEFVEIFNAGSGSVNLTGWSLVDASAVSKSLTALGTINPGGFKVLEVNEGWLNNIGGDTVILKNPSSSVVDSYSYFGTIGTDVSIGRDVNGVGVFKTCTTVTKDSSNNGSC